MSIKTPFVSFNLSCFLILFYIYLNVKHVLIHVCMYIRRKYVPTREKRIEIITYFDTDNVIYVKYNRDMVMIVNGKLILT